MTVATIVSVTGGAISLSVPMVQSGATHVPCEGVADTSVSPADSTSVTTRPVAGLGPLFCTVTVKVTFSPTKEVGAGLSTEMFTPTSAFAWPFSDGRGDVVAGHGVGLVLIAGPGPDS